MVENERYIFTILVLECQKNDEFWVIFLQYLLQYLTELLVKHCSIFLQLQYGKLYVQYNFFKVVLHCTNTAIPALHVNEELKMRIRTVLQKGHNNCV